MKALLGRKVGMTQIFDAQGRAVPVTVVKAGPCLVTGLKTDEKDGYSSVQLGFEEAKKPKKSVTGQVKKLKFTPRYIKEFKNLQNQELEIGSELSISQFEVGDKVEVSGTSKGKGFSGTVKRHNFSIGPKSHGSRNKRKPGSIGSMYPQKVYKGRKMPGHMGSERVTTKNLVVQKVDTDNNLIALRGAVPGPAKGIVEIRGL